MIAGLSCGCVEQTRVCTGTVDYYPQDWTKYDEFRGVLPYTLEGMEWNVSSSTGSMRPLIGPGTSVYTIPYEEAKKLRPVARGDIITFKKAEDIDGRGVIHRIIKIGVDKEGKYFITKGDNNMSSDDKIREWQITGVLVGVWY